MPGDVPTPDMLPSTQWHVAMVIVPKKKLFCVPRTGQIKLLSVATTRPKEVNQGEGCSLQPTAVPKAKARIIRAEQVGTNMACQSLYLFGAEFRHQK